MSYKALRYALREASLSSLERMHHELQKRQRAARPYQRAKIEAQLGIVSEALSRAYAVLRLTASL